LSETDVAERTSVHCTGADPSPANLLKSHVYGLVACRGPWIFQAFAECEVFSFPRGKASRGQLW
jgi:hypothetical protein